MHLFVADYSIFVAVLGLAFMSEDAKNVFCVLGVSYDVNGLWIVVADGRFLPIEALSWACLSIGALGFEHIKAFWQAT